MIVISPIDKTRAPLSLVHTSDISISTRSIGKQSMIYPLGLRTCKYKTTRIFLWFVFCSALGLCFDYVLMVVLMSLYMSQPSLHSFVFPFVCPYAYAYVASVKQALSLVHTCEARASTKRKNKEKEIFPISCSCACFTISRV